MDMTSSGQNDLQEVSEGGGGAFANLAFYNTNSKRSAK